jgi:hypothetical protein
VGGRGGGRGRGPAWLAALAVVVLAAAARAEPVLLDDFESTSDWTVQSSEGTQAWVVREPGRTGMGLRLGYTLNPGGGWLLIRKPFPLSLPANYAFTFYVRGEGRPNNFEFKLVDPSGKNVWWRNQRDFPFPGEWQRQTIRKSRLRYAWGPKGGGDIEQVGWIEFAISAGEGGQGSVWIDDLMFEAREPASPVGVTPDVHVSSFGMGFDGGHLVDGDPATRWRSEPVPREQWVLLDFGRNREYGGLVVDWDPEDYARDYQVRVSTDGTEWTTAFSTTTGRGGRTYIYLPDGESRFIRLDLQRSSRGLGYGIADLAVQPVDFSASPNDFFAAIARDAPVGMYPKYLYGRQTYWTVVGADADDKEALLNEEGMLEVDRGAFSIEPFLYAGGKLVTWSDVTTEQRLDDGYLPIPSVVWRAGTLSLTVTAFAAGDAGRSTLFARYRVDNTGDHGEPVRLYLAVRPFQVNPPWQSLGMTGGLSPIHDMRFDGRVVWVNRDRAVVSLTSPDQFGATIFEEGSIVESLRGDRVPSHQQVSDPLGFASAALQYNLYVEPKKGVDVDVAVPFHEPYAAAAANLIAGPGDVAAEQLERTRHGWRSILGRVEIDLPAEARKLEQTFATTIAYILINRDGPAIQPGSRVYARSWIRDGALTSQVLLETGFPAEVRDFLRWYAQYQAPDGKIPCCVDRRGADPVSEHDSAGQFIWAVMEYYRFTRDVGFVHDLWPNVVKAAEYLITLRSRRLGEQWHTPEKEAYLGILPESISHEGYAAHPVHSYWDDFFALRGFKDAADMAVVVGDDARAERYAAQRDDFRHALYRSIARTMATHGIDYIPGSVELGDFDPTSTSIAIAPGGELPYLPAPALAHTFDRYWADVERRRDGDTTWTNYTPYELRNVAALIRLGEKQRALSLLEQLVADQRPAAWNAWAEIAWRDPTAPRFIGDMPHTWVASSFVRGLRTMLVEERESDRALVVLGGVPSAWVTAAPGVAVRRLPTWYGVLNMTARAETPERVRVRLAGDIAVPPGGIVVRSPFAAPIQRATVNGHALPAITTEEARVTEFPADVVLEY